MKAFLWGNPQGNQLNTKGVEGQGIADKVIRLALEDGRALPVNQLCPFVISFIVRHPEYRKLVPKR